MLNISLLFHSQMFQTIFRSEPNLLDLVNINKYTLGKLKELLGGKVASEMKTVFDKLQQLRSAISAQNLDGLSFSKLQSLLSASFSSASGAKSSMISRILSKTENGKNCDKLSQTERFHFNF